MEACSLRNRKLEASRLLTACIVILVAVAATSPPAVQTPLGRTLDGGVSEFLGVPFASAARWQPPTDWNQSYGQHRLDATRLGPSCPQPAGYDQVWNQDFTSEQCLNLNVWCHSAREHPQPVFVFFFGGGFVAGGANPYNGSYLARTQQICVVVPNYRIGAPPIKIRGGAVREQ